VLERTNYDSKTVCPCVRPNVVLYMDGVKAVDQGLRVDALALRPYNMAPVLGVSHNEIKHISILRGIT